VDWFKVEARIGTNEKVDDLSDGAFRSLIHIWGYAMQHENGGRVPANAPRLIPRVTARRLEELVAAGFIHPNGAGYVIHDWDEHQEARRCSKARRAGCPTEGGEVIASAVCPRTVRGRLPDASMESRGESREEERRSTSHCCSVALSRSRGRIAARTAGRGS
jgi:hypothetical protein